jgi:hypothetical protein
VPDLKGLFSQSTQRPRSTIKERQPQRCSRTPLSLLVLHRRRNEKPRPQESKATGAKSSASVGFRGWPAHVINPKPRWTHYRVFIFLSGEAVFRSSLPMPMFRRRARHDGRSLGVQQRSLVGRYETSPSFEIAAGLFAIAAWVAILGYAFYRML